MEKGEYDHTKTLEQIIRRERVKAMMQRRKPPLFERIIKIGLFAFSLIFFIYFLDTQNENKKNTSIKLEELELVPKNKNKIEEYLKAFIS